MRSVSPTAAFPGGPPDPHRFVGLAPHDGHAFNFVCTRLEILALSVSVDVPENVCLLVANVEAKKRRPRDRAV
ncbi:MAG TPA: hypothetical protein VJK02_01375 [Anaerolineales bacterium]|nr:hypothetical protein [Anaerolineales bacterium]